MCCGRGREAPSASPGRAAPKRASGAVAHGIRVGVTFVYGGNTALTVTGPVSGLIYRFDRPGARLIVDPRDCNAMRSVPHLARSK
jgi:hypothetical protein